LLVDDDPTFRTSLAELLRDDGHELLDFDRPGVLPAYEALGHVGLVLTDYEMPGQNGLELADLFHASHPTVPVILVTGFHSDAIEAEAARRDFLHLVSKPVDYDPLHLLVHRLAR
jgi:FixJ family two-component response regulator